MRNSTHRLMTIFCVVKVARRFLIDPLSLIERTRPLFAAALLTCTTSVGRSLY